MLNRSEKNNMLSMDNISIKEMVTQFGTPLYIYSGERIKHNIKRLQMMVSRYFDKFRIQYAIKSNSNPHILQLIRKEGLGADCSSPAEAHIALKTRFPMNKSMYTGNFESHQDFQAIVNSGIIINLDDHHRLEELMKISPQEIISFRINPGMGQGGFEGIVTGGMDAKFGIPYEKTREAYNLAIRLGIKRFGIHMMTGSNILDPKYFAEVTHKLLSITGKIFGDLGIKPEFIDIGGGFGIPYTNTEQELDLDRTFKQVSVVFHENSKKYSLGAPELVVEPGRYIVGNAGVLVARVTHVKNGYKRFAGLDAGMNTLLRPALYGATHRILIDQKPDHGNEHYLVCGQICENSDIHPQERCFSEVKPGDLAVILDVGAYGYSMSSNYNNRPRPAEVLIHNNEVKLIRRAESIADLFRLVPEFN